MSRIFLPNKKRSKKIVVETREANSITNEQCLDVLPGEKKYFDDLKNQYLGQFDFYIRNSHSPYYNCHGLTFASRRTCVIDVAEIPQILIDDGYEEIPMKETLPGDIVLYYSLNGDIEHSGIVISKPNLASYFIPLILSKWGAAFEAIHPFNKTSYDTSQSKFYRVVK